MPGQRWGLVGANGEGAQGVLEQQGPADMQPQWRAPLCGKDACGLGVLAVYALATLPCSAARLVQVDPSMWAPPQRATLLAKAPPQQATLLAKPSPHPCAASLVTTGAGKSTLLKALCGHRVVSGLLVGAPPPLALPNSYFLRW